jgi:type I restriction enzyme M protein
MPARRKAPNNDTTANLGFEAKLWLTADKLRNNMDAAEYKRVVLGLIFLKYISDTFEEHRAKLLAGEGDYEGANPEDPDEYKAENVFWVPAEARWPHLQSNAKQPTIGKIVDDAMVAIERDNQRLKGVLPKDYARPALDKHRLGELIDLIGTIGLGDAENRAKDILGRVYEYFLTMFASAEGKNGGQFYTRPASCAYWWKCSPPTRAASTTPRAAPVACSCSRKNSSNPTAAKLRTSPSTARKATPPRAAWPS